MNCFQFSFKSCVEDSSSIIIDDLYPTLNSQELYGMFKDPKKALEIISDDAYSEMKDHLLKGGKVKEKRNIREGQRFETGTGKTSGYYEFESGIGQYSKIQINKFFVNLDFTGEVVINATNEVGQITTYTVDVEANITSEHGVDDIYEYVKIEFDDQTLDGLYVPSGVNGLIVDYSRICDIDSYICENKDKFLPLMKYKVGSMIISESGVCQNLGARTLDDKSYEDLRDDYEVRFLQRLKSVSLDDSGCVECYRRLEFPVSIP